MGKASVSAPPLGAEVPQGFIGLWSGAVNAIPAGWALCDGQSGTPDLRNRFVVGAGSSYAVGAAGGEATHTLTEAEMPKHRHGILKFETTSSHPKGPGFVQNDGMYYSQGQSTEYAGSSRPHNNLPPYYSLCYIMKL